MSNKNRIDPLFHFIMQSFIATGSAPHYTEIATEFNMVPEEGKTLLHELINTGIMPMWLAPGTDVIASFAPFNNLPSPYRITVEGQQKWYAQ